MAVQGNSREVGVGGLVLLQVSIVAVLKAMGVTSDQEIVQMVGRDPKLADLLAPSIQVLPGHLLTMHLATLAACLLP